MKLKFAKPTKVKKVGTGAVTKRQGSRKSRATPIAKLERQLDKLVSQYVILRDKKCVTCGSTIELGCGHVFSRRAKATRWDLLNCHTQCWPCNYKHVHDTYPYLSWFRKEHGQDLLDVLYARFHTIRKWSRGDLECIKQEMQKEIGLYENN